MTPLFIHAADIHLDSPLRGLTQDEFSVDVSEIRASTRLAFQNLIDLCLQENTPLLIISGDLYDGKWQDFSTGLFFIKQMQRLAKRNIKVAIVRGNHDAENKMTKTLVMPENVKAFSSKKPESWVLEDLNIALHGQSYKNAAVTDNLAVNYPPSISGYLNIGILHCLISGSSNHQPYAPCTVEELTLKNYDYWALGHVHQFQILLNDPFIIYPGCTQGRHIKETGSKGCMVVRGTHDQLQPEFVELETVRWLPVEIDITGTTSQKEVFEKIRLGLTAQSDNSDKISCMRIVLTGVTAVHNELLQNQTELHANCKAIANEAFNGKAMVQKVVLQSFSSLNFDDLIQTETPQGELLRLLDEIADKDMLDELDLDFTSLKSKLTGSGITFNPDNNTVVNARDILLFELSKVHKE